MDHQIHYFIAIPVGEKCSALLANWSNAAKKSYLFKQWTHPLDYHLTLVFLGHVSPELLAPLQSALAQLALKHLPFFLLSSHFGYFGRKERPRILYAGLDFSQALVSLQAGVYQVCQKLGLQTEERTYKPHITIAKRWAGEGEFVLPQFPVEGRKENGWDVTSIALYRSHPERDQKYEPFCFFPLQIND